MQNTFKKPLLRTLIAALGLSASLGAFAADPLKVGFVYI
ncbi:MAG: BMP family ABC transporter substrate-binding protein, partial [Pseudomonas sp.]